jgi:hypothetical protein
VTKKYLGTFNGVGWITEKEEDEVADKCIYMGGGMANGFYVNYLWDNSIEGCTLSHTPVAPKITNAPAAFVSSNGTENVFVTTGGGINHYLRSPGSSWGGEIVATGSTFKGEPTAYTDSKGHRTRLRHHHWRHQSLPAGPRQQLGGRGRRGLPEQLRQRNITICHLTLNAGAVRGFVASSNGSRSSIYAGETKMFIIQRECSSGSRAWGVGAFVARWA